MNSPTVGTASSAARLTCGRQTTTHPCKVACCGSTKGQTQYWGYVLAARAGLLTAAQAREAIANVAAILDNTPGRQWKSLQDSTNDPLVNPRQPLPWRAWQRRADYYSEGALIWLDVDTLIRERSGGKRSLDDFARHFFGVDNGSFHALTYTFEDVVEALNIVERYDWAVFLRARLSGHGPNAPLDGLLRGGYRLTYTDTQSDSFKQAAALRKSQDFIYSLGFNVGQEGALTSVLWGSPAFNVGLTIGARLIAVNGIAYDGERLKEVVTAATTGNSPIQLLVKSGDEYRALAIDYHGGLRYPHLEKIGTGPASLDDILTPRP